MSFRSETHSLIRIAVFFFNQSKQSLACMPGYDAAWWLNLSYSDFIAFLSLISSAVNLHRDDY